MKELVIAEKPSVGRDIAKVLGCSRKGDGFLEGDKYVVSWAIGHLVTLCEPEDYDLKLKQWNAKTLPVLPEQMKLKPVKKTYKQYNILKNLMHRKDIESIICATDAGREGELIFRYIYSAANCSKSVKRLWISSLTSEAIKEGFENLKDGNAFNDLYISARCRSESDWLVGINATRAYTVKYKNLFSIGRVQTPTLAIIVQREKEISKFEPKDYWELKCTFSKYEGLWIDTEKKDSKLWSEKTALEIIEKIKGHLGYVIDCEKKKIKKKPPLLYDLTELQRDANKKYGFTADRTLKIAQSLYEKRKAITYPRTDSKYLSNDLIKTLKTKIANLKTTELGQYCNYLLDMPKLPITKRVFDNSKVSDHHAIIPTDKKIDINKLSVDEKKIFYLIASKFLAVFYPDYIYESTTIYTEVNGENFKTQGQMVLQLGWRTVLSSNDDTEKPIPKVKVGEELEVKGHELIKKQTQPPKRFTESMLLSAMEHAGKMVDDDEIKEQMKDSGIGTPATRASIIERLIQVEYIVREGKTLVPTEKGKSIIELVPQELSSPEMTGKWERALNFIAKGKMDYTKFMEGIRRFTIFLVTDVSKRSNNVVIPTKGEQKKKGYSSKNKQEALGTCPVCKIGKVIEGSKNFYCSNYKNGCKFGLFKNDKLMARYKKKITKTIVKQLIQTGTATVSSMISPNNGGKFTGKIKLKELNTGYWGWEFDFEGEK